jgi:hypothetical protein
MQVEAVGQGMMRRASRAQVYMRRASQPANQLIRRASMPAQKAIMTTNKFVIGNLEKFFLW